MDCQHIRQNELHEKYLLNRLGEAEKSEYEEHIEACDSCREELAKQRTLIAGIRAVGHAEMKQRIREQVGELRPQPATDGSKWQVILKIAAVLFIIALVPSAIYYFRTDTGQPIAGMIKPESVPSLEQPIAPREPIPEEGASKESETDTERTDSDRQYADEISDADLPSIASAPSMPSGKTASSGMGGSGAARIHQEILEESESEASLSAQSTIVAKEMNKEERRSKLMEGDRYQFAEGESKREKILGLESEEPAERKFDALQTQELAHDLGKSRKKSIEVVIPTMRTAVFRSDQKMISVDFVPPNRELIMNNEYNLPQSFYVEIMDRDSMDWKMTWHVTNESLPYHPSQMEIVVEGNALYLTLPENNIYEIGTDADTTEAVLVKK